MRSKDETVLSMVRISKKPLDKRVSALEIDKVKLFATGVLDSTCTTER